jgi:hypothetical protein
MNAEIADTDLTVFKKVASVEGALAVDNNDNFPSITDILEEF